MPTMYRGPSNPGLTSSSGTSGGSSISKPTPSAGGGTMYNRPKVARTSSAKMPGHVGNYGGDAHSYLGHFRSPGVVKAGHNNFLGSMGGALGGMFGGGGPSGPTPDQYAQQNAKKIAKSGVAVNAATNPVLAARVAKRRAVSTAKASGVPGAAKEARESLAGTVKAAKKTRAAFTPKDVKTSQSAGKATLLGATNALKSQRQNVRNALAPGGPKRPGRAPMGLGPPV